MRRTGLEGSLGLRILAKDGPDTRTFLSVCRNNSVVRYLQLVIVLFKALLLGYTVLYRVLSATGWFPDDTVSYRK